jgi:hypothetical protein
VNCGSVAATKTSVRNLRCCSSDYQPAVLGPGRVNLEPGLPYCDFVIA